VNENITTRTAHSEALIVSGTGYDVDCGAMKPPRPLALVLERVWNTAVVGIPSGNDTAAQRNEWPHGMTQAAANGSTG
jgi:hypothetical protein